MIFNIGDGGPVGETLVVTAPAGVTVTVSKGNKVKTKSADNNGQATFKGLSAGTWTVSITDGNQTSSRTIDIVIGYNMTIGFFSASISVTYPEGSTCTCSDGATTLTAPDSSGRYTFVVPSAGTWTVTSTNGEFTKTETVAITTNGQNESVELLYRLYLFNDGEVCESVTGGWLASGLCAEPTTENVTPTIDTSSGMMVVTTRVASKNTEGCSIITNNAIDLTPYNKLRFDVENANAYKLYAGTKGAKTGDYTYTMMNNTALVTGTNEIDISSVSGSHVIAVCFVSSNGSSASATFESIYLE